MCPLTGKCSQSYCLTLFSTLPLASIPRITLDFIHHFFSLFHPSPLYKKTFFYIGITFSKVQFYPYHTILSEISISWKCLAKYPIYSRHAVYFYWGIINIQSTAGKVYNLTSFNICTYPWSHHLDHDSKYMLPSKDSSYPIVMPLSHPRHPALPKCKPTLICFVSPWICLYLLEFYINGIIQCVLLFCVEDGGRGSGFFHSVLLFWGSFMLLCATIVHCFLMTSSIPLCRYNTICSFMC